MVYYLSFHFLHTNFNRTLLLRSSLALGSCRTDSPPRATTPTELKKTPKMWNLKRRPNLRPKLELLLSDSASKSRVSLIPPSNASWPNGAAILILLVTSVQNLNRPNRRCPKENAPEMMMMPAPPRLPRRKGRQARSEPPLK